MDLFNVITALCFVAVVHLSNGLRIDRGRSGDKIFVNRTTCRQYNATPNPDGSESCLCPTNPPAVFGSRQEGNYQCMNFSHIQHECTGMQAIENNSNTSVEFTGCPNLQISRIYAWNFMSNNASARRGTWVSLSRAVDKCFPVIGERIHFSGSLFDQFQGQLLKMDLTNCNNNTCLITKYRGEVDYPFDSSRLIPTSSTPKSVANVNCVVQFVLFFTLYISVTECVV